MWLAPTIFPQPTTSQVDVWRVPLDAHFGALAELWPLLSEDELVRARRFVYDIHRHRYVVGRGALRLLLARYLGADPKTLLFRYGVQEKPELVRPQVGPSLHFNVSHSHQLALVAVAQGRALGVDVEHIKPERALVEIAQRFFAPAEVAAFEALPEAQWVEAFFNCWTRKEAYIKATGKGLTQGLDQFRVSLTPGTPARLIETYWDPTDAARWRMAALSPGAGYTGALLAEGQGWTLQTWSWTP